MNNERSLPYSTPLHVSETSATLTDVTPTSNRGRTRINLGEEAVSTNLDVGLGQELLPESPYGAPIPEIVETGLDLQSPRAINIRDIRKYESKFDQGYDSDGEAGPWCEMEKEEGPQFFEEKFLFDPILTNLPADEPPPSLVTNSTAPSTLTLPPPSPPPPNSHVPIDGNDLKGMKVAALKDELRARGESVSGNKSVLLRQLMKALENMVPVRFSKKSNNKFASRQSSKGDDGKESEKKKKDSGMRFFSKDSYWKEIFPLDDVVIKPENPSFANPRAPTVEEENASHVAVKHNFAEVFERPEFTGKISKPLFTRILVSRKIGKER